MPGQTSHSGVSDPARGLLHDQHRAEPNRKGSAFSPNTGIDSNVMNTGATKNSPVAPVQRNA